LDVLIHSKINRNVFFRPAELTDIDLYFNWTNDEMVRSNSYSSDPIPYENHVKWFHSNINKEGYSMLIFNNVFSQSIGQVRIQKNNDKSALIGISIDAHFRGKSYSTIMISTATQYYIQKYGEIEIHAYVKLENLPSKIAFEKAGYKLIETIDFENIPSNHLIF
jgi:RimJ/RimL family protein N-acetyltransferase